MGEKRFSYKEPEKLKQYLDGTGRIKSRQGTKLSKNDQKEMVQAVKRARHLALL